MVAATLTSKGQITIPAAVRASLGLETGARVEFVEIRKGRYEMIPASLPVQSLKGILRKPEHPVSIEQMNQVIAEQAGR